MIKKIFYCIIFFTLTANVYSQQSEATLYGTIVDINGNPLEFVNIVVKESQRGISSDINGQYTLTVPAEKKIEIIFSSIGFFKLSHQLQLNEGEKRELNIQMKTSSQDLKEFVVEDKQTRRRSISSINPTSITKVADMNSSIESILITMPGVSSKHEMSNQYAVRGGNFDENLIYVNGIRIYKPFLVRSGQQEGLSFINSQMVSSILFSAGGFDAKYGDKMSSVLDITYKTPQKFGGSATASLLGASLHLEGCNNNNTLSFLMGIRQKSNQYLLNGLQEKGEYRPSFTDLQAMVSYQPSEEWKFSFIGNISRNIYKFIPRVRETNFGSIQELLQLKIYFEGSEKNAFINYTGGLSANYKPFNGLDLSLSASSYSARENETYDILGEYWIGKLNMNSNDDNFGEVIENEGIGSFFNHARNYLDAKIFTLEHRGRYFSDTEEMEWGLNFQRESFIDMLNEWDYIDSSGYILPFPFIMPGTDNPPHYPIDMQRQLKANNNFHSFSNSTYFQITKPILKDIDLSYTAGVRALYRNITNEFLISPRATISYIPNIEQDILFRFSSGIYYQPPSYKEMRNTEGEIDPLIKSQKAYHFVLGSDLNFLAWNRRFKFTTELYHKYMPKLIPYEIDNVRLIYYPEKTSRGYASGIDLKINGEFVNGVESWASLSIMTAKEDIEGDYYLIPYNAGGEEITYDTQDKTVAYTKKSEIGFRPLPLDQRVNFSLFFQDYLPKLPSYKINIKMLLGTGLPVDIPGTDKNNKFRTRIPAYRRVDVGFSKQLLDKSTRLRPGHFLNNMESIWISLEVFNILQIKNTVSYLWVTNIHNQKMAVPNHLTPLQVNLKLHIDF